jgi:hypothetical protein
MEGLTREPFCCAVKKAKVALVWRAATVPEEEPLQDFALFEFVSVRVSSLLMGQPIVAQALLVLSLLSSQTLLPS